MIKKMAHISDVVEVNPRLPAEFSGQKEREVDFVPMAQLSEKGYVETNGSRMLGEVLKGYTYFANGDVIVAKITPCMENGKAAYVNNLPYGIAFGSTEFHVLRPGPDVDGRYLFYMVWNPVFRNNAEANMTGSAGQKRVPTKFFDRFPIPLPPLPEQKRIADILDKADTIRRKRQEALLLSDTLSTTAFLEFFGDPATNPNRWDKQQLSEVADILGGFAFKSKWFQEHGTKVVRIGDISDGFVSTAKAVAIDADEHSVSDTYRTRSGDVLMALSGATTGKTGIVLPDDDGVFVNQRIAIIRARTPELQSFIRVLLLDQRLLRRLLGTAGGSAQENLSPRTLASTEIPVPSTQTLERFHAVRQSLTRLRTDELKRGVSDSEQLFNSLVQRAFKGEL